MSFEPTPRTAENKGYENIFIARQPVFDTSMNLWAYELLYRDRQLAKNAVFVDKLQATLKVLSALPLCLDLTSEPHKVIVNFPSEAVINQMQSAYPEQITMVQLTDSSYAEEGLIDAVKELKKNGYAFSFDNFENNQQDYPFCRLADYITIDLLGKKQKEIERLVATCKQHFPNSSLIAKRIEEYDDYISAKSLGFNYFQGFFFKRPQVHSGRKIVTSSLSKLKIFKLLQDENVDFNSISDVLAKDVSIVHRLLVYINSPVLSLRKKINSVREALVIMGLTPLKKWLQIILLTDIKPVDKPHELVLLSTQRAYFLELLAIRHNFTDIKDRLFLLGLFSLIDAILDQPKPLLLSQLSLAGELEEALLGNTSKFLPWLDLLEHFEMGDCEVVEKISNQLGFSTKGMFELYEEAYHHARCFFQNE